MLYLILNRHPTIVGVLHIYVGEPCPLVAVTSLRSLGRGHPMWAMKNPWFFIGYIYMRDHTIQLYGDHNKALERSLLNNQYTSWNHGKYPRLFFSWRISPTMKQPLWSGKHKLLVFAWQMMPLGQQKPRSTLEKALRLVGFCWSKNDSHVFSVQHVYMNLISKYDEGISKIV